MIPSGFLIFESASLGNITTDLMTGRLVVVSTLTTPTMPGEFTTMVPIAFAGDVIGHYDSPGRPVAFEITLGAVGTGVFSGEVVDSARL